jgi:hypothetical protein
MQLTTTKIQKRKSLNNYGVYSKKFKLEQPYSIPIPACKTHKLEKRRRKRRRSEQ